MDDTLTAEDYTSVHRARRALADRYGDLTLNAALSAWAEFVADLEDGYDAEWAHEYLHDLRCRDWLAEAWPLLTPAVRAARQAELNALDARCLRATVPLRGTAPGPAEPGAGRWWQRRRPRLLLGADGTEVSGGAGVPAGWA
ncbi:hypothetical protein GCM10027168_23530 [Streptomyces capparidis]